MRARTLLVGITLAVVTLIGSAPAALAADADHDNQAPPSASAAPEPSKEQSQPPVQQQQEQQQQQQQQKQPDIVVAQPKAVLTLSRNEAKPGESFGISASCTAGTGTLSASQPVVSFTGLTSGEVADDAREGDVTIKLECVNGGGNTAKRDVATGTLKVLRKDGPPNGGPPNGGGNGSDPKAYVKLSGDTFYPGDGFGFVAKCVNGTQTNMGLDGPAHFDYGHPGRGFVLSDAREGKVTLSLVCVKDGKTDEGRDSFYVKRRDDGRTFLDLHPHSGFRGDEVDVAADCKGGGGARLESHVLEDIRLHRDGDRLRGETHVKRGADFGRDGARLVCDNGERAWDGFYVDRDEHDRYLDLDPGYGHRGDDIRVHVSCDRHLDRLESDTIEDIDLDRDGDHYWRFDGTTRVRSDAESGEHTIRVKCGDDWLEEDFFVKGDNGGSGGGDDNDGNDGNGQTSVYPKGGVETGGGPAEGVPFGAIALGLTGVLGAGLAGAGSIVERRAARR